MHTGLALYDAESWFPFLYGLPALTSNVLVWCSCPMFVLLSCSSSDSFITGGECLKASRPPCVGTGSCRVRAAERKRRKKEKRGRRFSLHGNASWLFLGGCRRGTFAIFFSFLLLRFVGYVRVTPGRRVLSVA